VKTYRYPARFTVDEDGVRLIRFRDFPEGISQAGPDQDAIDMAEGCLQACVEGRLEDGMEIPEPSPPRSGEVLVVVPLETAAKAALFAAVAESGMSRSALAHAVGLDEKEIRRMLDPSHSTKLPRIARVLRALGKELQLTVADAAQVPTRQRRETEPVRVEARQARARYATAPRKAKRATSRVTRSPR
jgi:antitoxin HicB